MNAKHSGLKRGSFKSWQPYLFICPFFLIFAIFGLYPFLSGIWISLQNKSGEISLQNYARVLTDSRFWHSISNATLYMLGSIFVILPVALGAAMLLNSRWIGRKSGTVSTIFFIPNITSVIVVGIVFKFILRTNGGALNTLLGYFGISPISFLSDPQWGVPTMIMLGVWRFFGINSLFFLSGLQGIPVELGEAARIDGANGWQEFWRITFPLLKPIMTYTVFTAITGSFALFGEVYTLVGGNSTGARDSFLYPVLYLYNTMFKNNQMNLAAAMGYVIALILLILTTVQRRLFAEKD